MADNDALVRAREGDLVISGFRLASTGLIVEGEPDFESWDRVGHFLRYVHTGAQFWIGDWINYGESKYGEKYAQALTETGYDQHTLENFAYVARSVPISRRREKVPFSAHAEIAKLLPDEQQEWLDRVAEDGLSVAELRKELRTARRRRVLSDADLPDGVFRVLYADPPWQYDDAGVIEGESGAESYGKAERHYPTMSIDELANLDIESRVANDAVLFLWVPAPLILQNPGPREVIEAWGFEPKAGFVWWKGRHNYGHYNSVQHEHLIICTRGSCTPDQPTPMPASVQKITPDRRVHSQKPATWREQITALYTHGPYLELFGREPVDGWTVFGNDPALGPLEDDIEAAPRAAEGMCGKHRNEAKPCARCRDDATARRRARVANNG